MQQEIFDILADKYLKGEASPEERRLLEEYLLRLANTSQYPFSDSESTTITADIYQRITQQIRQERTPVIPLETNYQTHTQPKIHQKPWFRITAAAAIIILAFSAYWFLTPPKETGVATTTAPVTNDLPPGRDAAILTLADGRQILLDTTANGQLAIEGQTAINKNQGEIIYNADLQTAQSHQPSAISQQLLSTPRGGQYQLTMSDGTKVWLNALSSIRFPASFTGPERRVEITGEAYFEVAHMASKPFHVSVNGMTIRVLGTHFNVNAYTDEASIKTTLLEGSVEVSKDNKSARIKPGQQAIVHAESSVIGIVHDADVQASVAWKNGYFNLNGANIREVMRQISRWYQADIEYRGDVSNIDFYGQVSRRKNVSELLRIMEKTGIVHFEIKGDKIIVSQ
jgi:transmembrane sensor